MHGIKALIFLSVFLVLVPAAGAKLIEDPEAVSYIHASVVKGGRVYIGPQGPLAGASGLVVYLSIPQNTERQGSVLQGVEGPDSHELGVDGWGNEILKLYWENPPLERDLYYTAAFDVEVREGTETALGKSFITTDMSKASLGMTEEAYNLVSGLHGVERIFRLTEWVHDWVDYDESYQDFPKSAEWVFGNRKGICSSKSNLLISLLRAAGFNAYYVIGYAYTEETPGNYWGPHGWVEAEYEGETISLDPTWLESPVDGTHIKFANAPDSNYTERAEIIGSNVRLVWDRNEPEIQMAGKEESGRIGLRAELIPEEVGSESHALLLTRVSGISSECVLSSMHIQGCIMDDRDFLDIPVSNQTLAFCGNDTLFWFVKTPRLGGGTVYTCPVSVYAMGEVEKPQIIASDLSRNIGVSMSTPKVLTPNQVFTVETTLENHGFSGRDLKAYLILGDSVQSEELELDPLHQAKLTWTLKAPASPGETRLSFFSSSGDLLEQDLTVITERHVKIREVSVPDNMSLRDSVLLNVTIAGLEQARGELQVRIEDEAWTREFYIGEGETKGFVFPYTPGSGGNKEVSIILLSEDQYEDGVVVNLLVTGETAWWEQIIEAIGGFFKWVASLFGF